MPFIGRFLCGHWRAPYVVSSAGESSANGRYKSYSTFDGVTSYKRSGHDVYLYRRRRGDGSGAWCIGPTHGGDDSTDYYFAGSESGSPYVGTYADGGVGADPDAVVRGR